MRILKSTQKITILMKSGTKVRFVSILMLLLLYALQFNSPLDYNISPTKSNTINPVPKNASSEFEQKASSRVLNYLKTSDFPHEKSKDQLLIFSSSAKPYSLSKIPPVKLGGTYLHFVPNVSQSKLREILIDPEVKQVLLDEKLNHSRIQDETPSKINLNSFVADDILGTRRVWDEFNNTGNDVVIGIIDSGVDFGISDLSESPQLLPNGITASFDPTGTSIGITSLNVSSIQKFGRTYLPLEGENITFWEGEYLNLAKSNELGIRLEDMDITTISKKSLSGFYQVGIMFQPGLTEKIPNQYFIFILVDSQSKNVYDTVYVDLDTSLAISLSREGIILESGEMYLSLVDWDLSDELPYGGQNPIIARDINGDGVNDVSMGALSTTLDIYGITDEFTITGILPSGMGISVMYDAIGHGTLSAAVAVSRGEVSIPVYDEKTTSEVENSTAYPLPGSAPGAKIIATKGAQSLSEFVMGWLWIAGLEPNLACPGSINLDPCWEVTTQSAYHRAHIASNSWGSGVIDFENSIGGQDFYSLFADYLSAPNLLYNGYPGIIFVTASGNSGPSYGNINRPGTSPMSITIGASSMYHFYNGTGGKNDVAWFSARGPTSYGGIKPDVVAPGNSGFTLYPVITGYGNGTRAAGIFGGTSESTPRAAGVVALIYEALVKQSINPNLENIRIILKGTAKNLGYHPIIQGSGLIDAYQAVSSINGGDQIFVSSTESSSLFGERLNSAFGLYFLDENDQAIDHPLLTTPLRDVTLSLLPSTLNAGLNLTISFANGSIVPPESYNIDVERLLLTNTSIFQFQSLSGGPTTINLENYWNLDNNWKNSELLQLSLSLDETSWKGLFDAGLSTPDMVLYDSASENYVFDLISTRTWNQQLYSGKPYEDFFGDPYLLFTDSGYIEEIPNWSGLTYTVNAQLYDYDQWSAIDVLKYPGLINIQGNGIVDELQFAYIRVQTNSNSLNEIRYPIIIAAEEKTKSGSSSTYAGDQIDFESPYDLTSIYGSFDWGTYPNTGDFRYYRYVIPVDARYFVIQGIWEDIGLVPDFYLFNSAGELIKTSDVTYIGGGFYDSSTSENFAQNLIVPAEDTIYTLLVHVASTPYIAGPIDLKIYSRYLSDDIPSPKPQFSQELSLPIEGDLIIDSSNYSISEFPELHVTEIKTQIYQGSNDYSTGKINGYGMIPGTATNISMIEGIEYIEFKKGEKVKLNLSWIGEADADMYVIPPGKEFSLDNDLLSGQGATSGINFEIGSFGVDLPGNYSIYIDYVDLKLENMNLKYNLTWETRDGPTLISSGDTLTINTEIFPNGKYGMLVTHQTNFDIEFESRFNSSFDNHIDFTATLLTPSEGTVSDNVKVSWEASTQAEADVSIKISMTEHIVGTAIKDSQITFDSKLYANGLGKIIVRLSDGYFLHILEVNIIINNNFPSTLPPENISTSRSLPAFSVTIIFYSIFLVCLIEKRRDKKIIID